MTGVVNRKKPANSADQALPQIDSKDGRIVVARISKLAAVKVMR